MYVTESPEDYYNLFEIELCVVEFLVLMTECCKMPDFYDFFLSNRSELIFAIILPYLKTT
jgi:hypothetical protein